MAEATKSTRTITTTEETFTLTLSPEEFEYLKHLIGEQPGADGNGASVRIWEALKAPTGAHDADRFTFKGVEYDLKADYRDPSGDLWRFTGARDANGEPLISCLLEDADGYYDWPLSRLVSTYSYGRGLRRA